MNAGNAGNDMLINKSHDFLYIMSPVLILIALKRYWRDLKGQEGNNDKMRQTVLNPIRTDMHTEQSNRIIIPIDGLF